MKKIFAVLFAVSLPGLAFLGLASRAKGEPEWMLRFQKLDQFNPVLRPIADTAFQCPVLGKEVNWESLYVYNPAATVKDGKVYLIYRGQGTVEGKKSLVSRLGLAWSDDGVHFQRLAQPVLYPDHDFMERYEWPGGCEDPRLVSDQSGTFYMTYTAYDGKLARLCVASSQDLIHWTKHGPAFARAYHGRYLNVWSKSGAIVSEFKNGQLLARKINGKYWMYWGDSDIFIATSDDLISWTPLEAEPSRTRFLLKAIGTARLRRLLSPRKGNFDSKLVESGPPPIITGPGIVFLYNSSNRNFPLLAGGAYAPGQVLIDPTDPGRVLSRTDTYFLSPENAFEKTGQVDNVIFAQGLALFKEKLFLYYGAADSVVGVCAGQYPPR